MEFLIAMIVFGVAAGFYQGSFNNYMAEVQKITALRAGSYRIRPGASRALHDLHSGHPLQGE